MRLQTEAGAPQRLAEAVGGIEYDWPVMVDGEKTCGVCPVGFPVVEGAAKGFATAGRCGNAGAAVSVGCRRRPAARGVFFSDGAARGCHRDRGPW